MPPLPHPTHTPLNARCAPQILRAGGSQGDIYAIKKTVEELNAIYQVSPHPVQSPLCPLATWCCYRECHEFKFGAWQRHPA